MYMLVEIARVLNGIETMICLYEAARRNVMSTPCRRYGVI